MAWRNFGPNNFIDYLTHLITTKSQVSAGFSSVQGVNVVYNKEMNT